MVLLVNVMVLLLCTADGSLNNGGPGRRLSIPLLQLHVSNDGERDADSVVWKVVALSIAAERSVPRARALEERPREHLQGLGAFARRSVRGVAQGCRRPWMAVAGGDGANAADPPAFTRLNRQPPQPQHLVGAASGRCLWP